jgi:hypothetical protein
MEDSQEPFGSRLEWEGLQSTKQIIRLTHSGELLKGSATATVKRGDEYQINCEVYGVAADFFQLAVESQNIPFRSFNFSGDCACYTTDLSNCYVTGWQGMQDARIYQNNSFKQTVHTDLVEQKAAGTWSESTHIDWFLNGPKDFVWQRRCFRQHDYGYSRAVDGTQEYKLASSTTLPSASTDSILVQLPDFSFVVRLVPKQFGPSWSKNLAIEYSTKLSKIPDEITRKAIAEVASFVLGRRVIDIGDTTFSDEGITFPMRGLDREKKHLVVENLQTCFASRLRSWNPSGVNIRALCSKLDLPPIPIERLHRDANQDVEAVMTKLVPAYLKYRDTLALDHALWRYWTFQELPLGINLPMLVSGIEILAKAWFASPYSTSHGNYTPKEQFLTLLKQDFESIRAKLVNAGKTDSSMQQLQNDKTLEALMERVQNSFEMGIGAKTRRFFEELGWQPTEKENEALTGGRGKQAHGYNENEDVNELYVMGESLRTLFYKSMLSLLGYSGEYFDYAKREVQVLNSAPLR